MSRRRWKGFAVLVAVLFGLAVKAQTAVRRDAEPPASVEAKLDATLDTAYTKAGDHLSATTQQDITVNDLKLPKGSRLTGTVVKTVRQDKQHANAGMVLLFDSAQPKGGAAVPIRAVIMALSPSHADEIEKVDVGSGDVTDASLAADVASGTMDDANHSVTARSTTAVNGVRVTSNIKGVVLFASPNGSSSGVLVARKGPLQLDKWTRITFVLSPR